MILTYAGERFGLSSVMVALCLGLLFGVSWAQAQTPALDPDPEMSLASDLSVQYISRQPRYPRYCLEYSQDVPQLCEGTEEEQRFPKPGEVVTLTAHLVNQGQESHPGTLYRWIVDGTSHQEGILPALSGGDAIDISWTWPWQTGVHTITLAVDHDPMDLTPENNVLHHRTDAHYLEILVHPYYVQAFSERRNLVGSYSFADWLQAQVQQLNQRLESARYEGISHGVADRVRIDRIRITEDTGGDTVVGDLAFDGAWTFRVAKNYRDTPEDEAWLSAQNYADMYAARIDWGLLHELAHQIGLIDLYQLNVSPSAGNQVRDGSDLPLLSGFYWVGSGLMGGDISPLGSTYFSEHSALALSSHSGYRRGYFGEYLYDVPQRVRLQVLDRAGDPLPAVQVQVFQTNRNVVSDYPVMDGITDEQGLLILPNRPVTPTLVTATGHTFRPNPFGHIDVVGRNGQLLIQLHHQGQETYRWLPITELNKLYWRGHGEVTIPMPTNMTRERGDAPMLEVMTEGSTAYLSWNRVANALSYRIYGGEWPTYYPLSVLADGIREESIVLSLFRTSRFAVTALMPNGVESALSNVVRAEVIHAPTGLVWQPASAWGENGQLLVVDAQTGWMIRQLPPTCPRDCPARWVGQMGSEHWGMVGATAAYQDPQGFIVVAQGPGQRVWIFADDRADGFGLQPIYWLGQVPDRPSPISHPAGVTITGPPFTVEIPLSRPDPKADLLLTFDGHPNDDGGTSPTIAQDIMFVPGRYAQAVHIGGPARLQYPVADFPSPEGSVEFWIRPDWPGDDKEHHVLLDAGFPGCDDGVSAAQMPVRPPPAPASLQPLNLPAAISGCGDYRLRVAQIGGSLYAWVTDFDQVDKAAWGDVATWQPGEWHHVAVTWNDQRLNLHVDGRLLWGEALRVPFTGDPIALTIGHSLEGDDVAAATFDSFRLSRFPRLGNSQETRILIAEEDRSQVQVVDLLGNPVTTYVPDDDMIHAFGSMAIDKEGMVWVIDKQARTIEKLQFADDRLKRVGSLDYHFSGTPVALALREDGMMAVAEENQVLGFDLNQPGRAPLVWRRPDHSGQGPFRGPIALAFGPRGDLAVAERGNRRISFVALSSQEFFQFLPIWHQAGT